MKTEPVGLGFGTRSGGEVLGCGSGTGGQRVTLSLRLQRGPLTPWREGPTCLISPCSDRRAPCYPREGGDESAASAQRTRRFWQEMETTEVDAVKSPVTCSNWPRVSEHFLLFFPSVSSLKLFQQAMLRT